MPSDNGSFWFKSSLFEIEPGEDKAINPGIYGKQLADWLANKLRAIGYDADVVQEDWGRCIMCQRDPVWLWVGCANIDMDYPNISEKVPKTEDIVWHCFVECEVPFLKRLFKRVDTGPFQKKLTDQLSSILASEPEIKFTEDR